MNRILLCTDGSPFAQSSYYYGAWFADKLGASVDILYVSDDRGQSPAEATDLSGSIGLGASETLLKKLVEVEHQRAKLNHQQAKLILADAEQALTRQGAKSIKLVHKIGFLIDHLETLEASTDLIVLGQRGETADSAPLHLGTNVDRIVHSSTKPCLVTPRQFAPIERLLLAYDGSPTGKRLLKFLADTPGLQHLDIHLLMAVKSESDPKIGNWQTEAVALLQQAGIKPTVSQPMGKPEKLISQYIEEHNISLLLMGIYGDRQTHHLAIGNTTIQLLSSSHIPVLLLR
ncbi:MAG: universal stress protein [Tildeniella torsiva UHER 1998/13D]|jgi:nucleotide-binding universal stress UspA family protein|nr:universal stress protein [Tildeniella torsiva UHER 1998/13D]